MNTMSIQVSTIDVKAIDERGALHYFSTDRTGEFLLVYRNAGTISGQHYHNGIFKGKNPEEMLLVQGEITLNWKDIQTQAIGTLNIKSPSRVIIPAKIWHEVKAITDIVFIELNSLKDGSEDTYRL
jgi:dTDP-4-dehydrorhamnose 3,5-epimerase-like enzyme